MGPIPTDSPAPARPLPLAGLRVVEFTHMVMGPTCGKIVTKYGLLSPLCVEIVIILQRSKNHVLIRRT